MSDPTPASATRTRRSGHWSRRLLAVAGALALLVAACSSEVEPNVSAGATSSTTTTAPPLLWPLTGLPAPDAAAVAQSALVAKIDNNPDAWPHGGINQADLVYEILVEGITRFGAVFHSNVPDRVGPVRSARSTDVDLVSNLGVPLLLWSGGNANVVAEVNAAAANGLLVNAGYDVIPADYYRVSDRFAPHNLFANPVAIRDALGGAGSPVPLYSYLPAGTEATGEPTPGIAITFAPGSTVTWVWDAAAGCARRYQAGVAFVDEAGEPVCATNVVLQFTEYGPSTADARSPQAYTIGAGGGLVYTGGKVTLVNWNRPGAADGPNLTAPDGSPALLTPGTTWVALAPNGEPTVPIDAAQAAALLGG